jgi:DNA polymerase III delta prime subunit
MIDRLYSWLRSPGAQPAVILSGGESADALMHLAQAAVCSDFTGEPCGKCTACQQAKRREHPDILYCASTTATITIKIVAALQDALSRTAFTKRRLVIIEEAEKISLPAVSALLKSLEEPSATTRYLLVTHFPRRLPATIRSRCQSVRLPAVAEASAGLPPTTPAWEVNLVKRLARNRQQPLSAQEIAAIAKGLENKLRTAGPSPALTRAFLRLRDYHRIGSQRGNEKLAADVLLASLP